MTPMTCLKGRATVLGLIAVFASCFLASVSTAQTFQTNSLETCRAAYDKAAAKIEDDAQQKKDAALIQYGEALDAVLTTLKKKGDIDSYSIVDHERKRLQVTKVVSTTVPAVQFEGPVTTYRKQIQEIQADRDRRKIDLLKRYAAALGTLIKDLMLKDNIEDAKAAGEVKKEAEFLLADMEPRQSMVEDRESPENVAVSSPKTEQAIVGVWDAQYGNWHGQHTYSKDGIVTSSSGRTAIYKVSGKKITVVWDSGDHDELNYEHEHMQGISRLGNKRTAVILKKRTK